MHSFAYVKKKKKKKKQGPASPVQFSTVSEQRPVWARGQPQILCWAIKWVGAEARK